VLGGLLLGLLSVWRRRMGPWLVVLAWAGYTFLLILANSSYYPQYYVQLAVPLCLLGGGLLGLRSGPARRGMSPGLVIALGILAIGLMTGGIARQFGDMVQNLKQTETTYTEVASYIQLHSSPEARVLVFEPNYTFLSSRPPAGIQEGHFLVDSYGEMLYLNLGIRDRSLWELATGALTEPKGQLQPTFWARPAQEEVLATFERATLVVVDGRARYQLEPQTLAEIQQRSTEVFAVGVASLRKKVQ
jgi:hypothetical protein